MQLRDEARTAEEALEFALMREAESRALETKIEERVARRAKEPEQFLDEQAATVKATVRAQEPAQSVEEQRQTKQQATEERARREQELQAAILERRKLRRQAAAAYTAEETQAAERRSRAQEQRRAAKVESEGLKEDSVEPKPTAVEEQKATQQREKDESHVDAIRQLRSQRQQQWGAESASAEAVAAERQRQRKELKRLAGAQARVDIQAAEQEEVEAEPDTGSVSTLSAESPAPAQLATMGNFVIDANENAVALRGINVAGLDMAAPAEGQTLPDAMALDASNLALITGSWGLNLIRLPFQAETVLSGNGSLPAASIVDGLDLAITLISDAGAYALLALEAASGATLPDAASQEAWQVLAQRYKDEPAVLYELFWSPGPLAPGWQQAALNLLGTIRQYNSAAMVFVNTGTSGADFSGLPLTFPTGTPIFNVVYTVNVTAESTPGLDNEGLAAFADVYPVFASTWSDDAESPSRLSPYVGDFFGRHNIGWAAASWNADPRLVADALNHDFSPTGWGLIAGRAATLPVQPFLKPF